MHVIFGTCGGSGGETKKTGPLGVKMSRWPLDLRLIAMRNAQLLCLFAYLSFQIMYYRNRAPPPQPARLDPPRKKKKTRSTLCLKPFAPNYRFRHKFYNANIETTVFSHIYIIYGACDRKDWELCLLKLKQHYFKINRGWRWGWGGAEDKIPVVFLFYFFFISLKRTFIISCHFLFSDFFFLIFPH